MKWQSFVVLKYLLYYYFLHRSTFKHAISLLEQQKVHIVIAYFIGLLICLIFYLHISSYFISFCYKSSLSMQELLHAMVT